MLNKFPNETELSALKRIMDGKTAKKRELKSGMIKINARNLYDIIVWGLRTGVIQDKPIKGIKAGMFGNEGFYDGYPIWYQMLNQIASGNKPDLPNSQIEYYKNWIDKKFNLNGTDAQRIRFAIASLSPIEPPEIADNPWRPWTGSRSSLMRIPQTHTGSMIDPEGTITKKTTAQKALQLLGAYNAKMKKKNPWDVLEFAKQRRNAEIQKLHPIANRHPETPDQEKQVKMASKQLAVVNAAWERVRILFARKGYALMGDDEFLRNQKSQIYIPGRH